MSIGPRHFTLSGQVSHKPMPLYDRWLLLCALSLAALGMMMVASSSIVIAERLYHQPFHFLIRQGLFLIIGMSLGVIVLRTPMAFWEKISPILMISSVVLLVAVLIPGIGRSVNGSMRWIGFGPIGFQVSEFAKLGVTVYFASYLVRHNQAVHTELSGFMRPLIILAIVGILLLKEPDFGATIVISVTAFAMLFLAGAPLRYFFTMLLVGTLGFLALAVSSPYRLARMTSFLNPWADQFNSGYQLTQSLIAFGRGGWFGMGLGESIQKLFYLPEAHNDFILAVVAEELGLVGLVVIIGLYAFLVTRALLIARRAQQKDAHFAGYLAYGLSFWLSFQALVNIGVTAGLLPTKGLTLPLMSYGGSSLLMSCIAIALLLRIDHETRWQILGLGKKS